MQRGDSGSVDKPDNLLNRQEVVGFVRESRAGDVSLGRLFDLVAETLELRPGEIRMVGWTKNDLPGLTIAPQASQTDLSTLVLVHLRRGALPGVERDFNSKYQVVDIEDEEDDLEGGSIGVGLQDLTIESAKAMDIRDKDGELLSAGAHITRVTEGAPADPAGLRPGDVVIKYDGIDIKNASQLRKLLKETKAETTVEIEFVRTGRGNVTVNVTVQEAYLAD